MSEWLKEQHWKCCVLARVPRVRIPVSPRLLRYKHTIRSKVEQSTGDNMKTLAIASIALLGLTLSACKSDDDGKQPPADVTDAGGDVVTDPADSAADAAVEAGDTDAGASDAAAE
jgi:hypothetical protein